MNLERSPVKVLENKKVSEVLTTEVAMFYYLFKIKKPIVQGFTSYKESGIVAVLLTVGFLTVAELIIVHILVERWSTAAAWILTGISFYTLLQMISLARSLILRKTVIKNDQIDIHYGWLKSVSICKSQIEHIELNPTFEDGTAFFLFKDLEVPNVLIELTEPVEIAGIYGINKTSNRLLLHLDDPNGFVSAASSDL